ncbi:glycosyltransferase [Gemella sp. WT2a]|nr:glycosyltransferase [Gemella sp. WT2a]
MRSNIMNKALISVIIPVYNVKDYLEDSVKSVRNQTLKNIEIILVDDGSTDGSSELCDRLANEDARIKVIHKENGGVSDARNVGMEGSNAEYIGFVDSDDFIEPNMYEILYREIEDSKADLAYCDYQNVENITDKPKYSEKKEKFVYSGEEIIKNVLYSNNITMHLWTKLYKKEIALKHKFPVGKTYEDAFFTIPYFLDCKKAVEIRQPLYRYVKRQGSIVNSPYTKSDLAVLEAHKINYNLLKNNPKFLEGAEYRLYWSNFYILDRMLKTDNFDDLENKEKVIKFLKGRYIDILKNKYVKNPRKLAMTMLMINENLYKLLLKLK